jgi:hypothetical protein
MPEILQCLHNSHVKVAERACILSTTKGFTVMNTGSKIGIVVRSRRQPKKMTEDMGVGWKVYVPSLKSCSHRPV